MEYFTNDTESKIKNHLKNKEAWKPFVKRLFIGNFVVSIIQIFSDDYLFGFSVRNKQTGKVIDTDYRGTMCGAVIEAKKIIKQEDEKYYS